MQHLSAFLALLLVTVASAAPSQSVEPAASSPSSVSVPVVGSVAAQAPVVGAVAPLEVPQSPASGHQHQHQHQHQLQHSQVHPAVVGAAYYSPAAGVQVVGAEQQVGGPKPVVASVVRGVEQYGQPEPASLPANYKPFGSWGLYVGGNPADGYYNSYYKALSNSLDQQQSGEPVKPTAALSPVLRQASSSPYVGSDYYPFAYSPAELNSGARVAVEPAHGPVSPVHAYGAHVYGAPSSYESHYPNQVSSYAGLYATKKVGSAYTQQREVAPVKEVAPVGPTVQAAPSKGYQSRTHVYPFLSTASAQVQHAHQGHQAPLVAYHVPNAYGAHTFSHYAVKPTAVSQDASYFYGSQGVQHPLSYKQQVSYSPMSVGQAGYPFSFHSHPVGQLHYSQGSVVPQDHPEFHQYYHQHQAAPSYSFPSSPVKAEEEQVNKPQQQ